MIECKQRHTEEFCVFTLLPRIDVILGIGTALSTV